MAGYSIAMGGVTQDRTLDEDSYLHRISRYQRGHGRDANWYGFQTPILISSRLGTKTDGTVANTWEDTSGDLRASTFRVRNAFRSYEHNDDKWFDNVPGEDHNYMTWNRVLMFSNAEVGNIEMYDRAYMWVYGGAINGTVKIIEPTALNDNFGPGLGKILRIIYQILPSFRVVPEFGSITHVRGWSETLQIDIDFPVHDYDWPYQVGDLHPGLDFSKPVYIDYEPRLMADYPPDTESVRTVKIDASRIDMSVFPNCLMIGT